MLVNKGNKLSALTCMLALVVFAFAVPSTSVRAGIVYTIELTGDSTAIGSLEWAGDLSSDGAFLRLGTDINDLSITVAGVTFTEIAELGPFSDADGIVRLLSAGRIERRKVARLSSLGARHLRPCLKRFGTQRTIIDCPEQMTPKAKQIVALAVRAQKSLRMTVRTKASHLPFLLSGMFM
jgi:hypothetical protein